MRLKNILTSSQEREAHAHLVIAHIDYVDFIAINQCISHRQNSCCAIGMFVKLKKVSISKFIREILHF
jgi:hypothetical protein